MAKHRAFGDDLQSREESTGVLTSRPDGDRRWPAPRRERSGNTAGVLARPSVVGVARVPATSRLTPPGQETRNQGPRALPAGRPAVVPAPAGRHRRAAEPEC
ncbi:hypothetical protein [Micromonospora sp. NPDC051296]|uniref:hypothetical protein n=1 Tax=Micromonospora sp. NPDC051296 TaxID=3155046 RepID=UPI003428B828